MSAPWLPYAPVAVVALVWAALSLHAWRKRALKRRMGSARIGTDAERHIAVGSLSGVAPSDVKAHVLIVLGDDGGITIEGTGAGSLRMVLLTSATAALARDAYAALDRDRENGGPS